VGSRYDIELTIIDLEGQAPPFGPVLLSSSFKSPLTVTHDPMDGKWVGFVSNSIVEYYSCNHYRLERVDRCIRCCPCITLNGKSLSGR
jgi:hypothetical protein